MKTTKGSIAVDTFYTDEHDFEHDITCWVWVSAPEPDVGFNGDIEIESVFKGQQDITNDLSDLTYEILIDRCDAAIQTMDEYGEP